MHHQLYDLITDLHHRWGKRQPTGERCCECSRPWRARGMSFPGPYGASDRGSGTSVGSMGRSGHHGGQGQVEPLVHIEAEGAIRVCGAATHRLGLSRCVRRCCTTPVPSVPGSLERPAPDGSRCRCNPRRQLIARAPVRPSREKGAECSGAPYCCLRGRAGLAVLAEDAGCLVGRVADGVLAWDAHGAEGADQLRVFMAVVGVVDQETPLVVAPARLRGRSLDRWR